MKMKFRKTLISGLCVASLAGIAVPLTTSAAVAVYFNTAPPEARYERVPAPRNGYVWSSGYWNTRGDRHVWQSGSWQRNRSGYNFSQPRWTQQGDRWQLEQGRWNKGSPERERQERHERQ
jgi:hypothetical protein